MKAAIWIAVATVVAVAVLLGKKATNATVQTSDLQKRIRVWAANNNESPALVLAFCEVESSFNPLAHSKRTSYGLMEIYHSTDFSWLRYFGYKDSDQGLLYDPEFNVNLGCKVIKYFRSKGYVFPDQADIYNVGETLWNGKNHVRNADYRNKIIAAMRKYA
jgi:soluble lytic murein transglycosylase-like protein